MTPGPCVRPVGDSKMHPEPPSQIGNLIRFGDFTVYECAAEQHCPAPDAKNVATLDGSRCMNVRWNKTEPHFVQSTKLRKATPPRTPRSMFLDFLRPGVRSGFECLRGRRHARPSVPTTGTNTPETLNGGCGGSVAFLLVLIVDKHSTSALKASIGDSGRAINDHSV